MCHMLAAIIKIALSDISLQTVLLGYVAFSTKQTDLTNLSNLTVTVATKLYMMTYVVELKMR